MAAALKELQLILGDRDPIQVGGYTIRTTLDWRAQEIGDKLRLGRRHRTEPAHHPVLQADLQARPRSGPFWIDKLRPLGVRNGALVAMDYSTGDILAYVASARPAPHVEQPQVRPHLRPHRPGQAPAGLGLEAHRLRQRHRFQAAHGRHRSCSISPRPSAAAPMTASCGFPRTPTEPTADPSRCATRCSNR